MKKTITKIGMVMLICLTVLFTNSCKKKGCIDPDSTNYDSKAKEDDGSCQYKGSAVLWLSQSSSANAVSLGWTNLKICDGNGNVINNVSTSIYFNSNFKLSTFKLLNKLYELSKFNKQQITKHRHKYFCGNEQTCCRLQCH